MSAPLGKPRDVPRSRRSKGLPVYMGRQTRAVGPEVEREHRQRVFALYDHFWHWLAEPRADSTTECDVVAPRVRYSCTPETSPLDEALLREAHRVLGHDQDHVVDVVAHARPLALWALQATMEHNVDVAAAFGAEFAFDALFRVNVRAVADEPRPLCWRWQGCVDAVGLTVLRQVYDGVPEDYLPPILGAEIARLGQCEAPLEEALRSGNLTEPRFPIKNRYQGILDPLRPPLVAVRLAAHLIEEETLSTPRDILALELGHSLGPQALSIWLPHSRVHTWSSVIEPWLCPKFQAAWSADAVVLGIPPLRHLRFVRMMANRNRQIDRRDVDALWQTRDRQPHQHVAPLVDAAAGMIKLGAVLVVIGAVEEGEHHHAAALVRASGLFAPLQHRFDQQVLDTGTKPVLCFRRKDPWPGFGVLPAGDRLISAWRRIR